jgi:hypothetical protein
MNARPVTDTQISRALRAHLPEQAAAGLRERVIDAAETTAQLRSFPSFLGALTEADPESRRRSLLIAAALLVALAFASAAAVGALRLLQRDPVDELSLEPPTDIQAFVLSSYERLPQLPPVVMTWRDSDSSDKGRIFVHRSGAVRFDRFTSVEATEPSSYTILSDHRVSGMAPVESGVVWVEPGHEAIGEDPRVFIRTVLNTDEGPGCEMERDPSQVGNGTAARGWRYVGAEYVAGRPTHHVACVGELSLDIDVWLDIETRLILRTRAPRTDDAGQPIAGQFRAREVTEIALGEQPAALFEPPEGVAHMTSEAYSAYLCTRDVQTEIEVGLGTRECAPPEQPEVTPQPMATPMPNAPPSLGPRASGPAGPLTWTQARLVEDWPAPVRPEPAGGASVQPMPFMYIDPTGDTGSDVDPWVDIREIRINEAGTDLWIELATNSPPAVDPSELWIAFGLVVDTDRDGVPDVRYGMDNLPRTVGDELGYHRAWRTDLHTGLTVAGTSYGYLGETFLHTSWPGVTEENGLGALFDFGGGETTTGAPFGSRLEGPLYAWAAVIENGRVVATDYAPDVGWLVATPGAQPGGTYLLEDPFPVRLAMTVADGWTIVRESRFYHVGGLTRDDASTGLRFVMVDTITKDACAKRAGAVDGRATVDDLVAFLAGLPLIDISENRDVTLDGYRGKYLEFTRTAGEIDCGWGGLDGWPASSPTAIDESNRVWILDVDGAPLVIDAFSDPEASANVRAELRQIVESIQIEP